MQNIIEKSLEAGVDYFFIGGSLVVNDMLDHVLKSIKELCPIPLILFPGNSFQLSYRDVYKRQETYWNRTKKTSEI